MKKMMIGLLGLGLLTGSAVAATASNQAVSTVEKSNVWNMLKASKYHLSLETEHIANRKDKETSISGVKNNLYPFLGKDLGRNDRFDVYTKITINPETQANGSTDYRNDTEYVAFKYGLNNILSQEAHGVNLHANIRYYNYLGNDNRVARNGEGLTNLRVYTDRKITDKFSISNENRLYILDKDDNTAHSTKNRYGFIQVSPRYDFSPAFSAYVTFHQDFSHFVNSNANYSTSVVPGIDYQINEKLSANVEVAALSLVSGDNKTFARTQLDIAPTLSYSFNDNVAMDLLLNLPMLNKEDGKFVASDIADTFSAEIDLHLMAF